MSRANSRPTRAVPGDLDAVFRAEFDACLDTLDEALVTDIGGFDFERGEVEEIPVKADEHDRAPRLPGAPAAPRRTSVTQ